MECKVNPLMESALWFAPPKTIVELENETEAKNILYWADKFQGIVDEMKEENQRDRQKVRPCRDCQDIEERGI